MDPSSTIPVPRFGGASGVEAGAGTRTDQDDNEEIEMAEQDCVRIEIVVDANFANARHRIVIDGPSNAEWSAMSDDERQDWLDEAAEVEVSNTISAAAYVVDE